ncbi:MAG: fumarate hydratase C-terminal domain-containing protein [Methanobacteriaceae archaeon]|nr:fumarate hydratase C-terminal domain-containing protein [Methanobacteriaceae archaeon]
MKKIKTPVDIKSIESLDIGDQIEIYGEIFTGRDAALPQLVKELERGNKILDLEGSVIMHTAVSDAGIAPTSSNKEDIEENIPALAQNGVKIHLGKGKLKQETIKSLNKAKSVYVITPPVAALLSSKIFSKKIIAFPEEGMEALYQLEVNGIPGIVAAAHGNSIYDKNI